MNGDRNIPMRVLFDSGSQRSFVIPWLVGKAGLHPARREMFGIKAFGGNEAEYVERDLVEFYVMNVKGGEKKKISAFVFNKISDIPNVHLEIAKRDFNHLSKIWLSDVNKEQERLELDVLIGADFYGDFKSRGDQ